SRGRSWGCRDDRSRRYGVDDLTVEADSHSGPAREARVDLEIARIDPQRAPAEARDLRLRGDDHELVAAPDHPGRELLVPTAQHEALPTPRRDDDPRLLRLDELEQGPLVRVGGDELPPVNDVHSEQRLLEAEEGHQRSGGRAGADQPHAVAEH